MTFSPRTCALKVIRALQYRSAAVVDAHPTQAGMHCALLEPDPGPGVQLFQNPVQGNVAQAQQTSQLSLRRRAVLCQRLKRFQPTMGESGSTELLVAGFLDQPGRSHQQLPGRELIQIRRGLNSVHGRGFLQKVETILPSTLTQTRLNRKPA